MDPDDAAEQAAIRAELAGRRTRELADRLQRLAQGKTPDTEDVRAAQQRAEEAAERAQDALERSVLGHERAARSHEMTAAAHDRAAQHGVGDTEDHRRRAEQHRRDAALDRAAADTDRSLALAGPNAGAMSSGAQAPPRLQEEPRDDDES